MVALVEVALALTGGLLSFWTGQPRGRANAGPMPHTAQRQRGHAGL